MPQPPRVLILTSTDSIVVAGYSQPSSMLSSRSKDHSEFYMLYELNTTSAVLKHPNFIAKGFQGGPAAYWQNLPSLLTHIPRALLPTEIKASLDFLSAFGDRINSRVDHRNGTQSHHKLLNFLLFRRRAQGRSTLNKPSRLRRHSSFLLSISTQPKLQEGVLRKPVPRKHLPSKLETPPTSIPAQLAPAAPASDPSSNQPRSLLPRITSRSPTFALLLQTNSYFFQSTRNLGFHC